MDQVVVVALTDEQKAAIDAVMDQARLASIDREPGMVVAQVFPDEMVVGFLPADRALPIARLVADGVRIVRTADDL